MNRKGFTLVELIATIVILGIIMGIVIISTNGGFGKAKEGTEEVFVKTLEDALKIYLDSDAKDLNFDMECSNKLNKTHKNGVKVYKATKDKNGNRLTFQQVIDSTYHPISESDMHNPANKGTDRYACIPNQQDLYIYRDEDYVYYYKTARDFGCLNKTGTITNLPDNFNC